MKEDHGVYIRPLTNIPKKNVKYARKGLLCGTFLIIFFC